MEKEIWRAVVGYEGLYEVSDLGNIRSVDHYGWSKGHVSQKIFKGKMLTPQISVRDNNRISVRVVFSDHKKKQVARLVAAAFPEICGKMFEGCQIHHKDINPKNNAAENLIVLTEKEHFAIHYSMGKNQKEHNPNFGRHISEKQKSAVRDAQSQPIYQIDNITGKRVKWFPSAAEASRQTGICKSTIERVANHKPHYLSGGGYKWEWV